MDVLKKINDSLAFSQGGIVVSIGVVGVTENHIREPFLNYIPQFIPQSGILDDRFVCRCMSRVPSNLSQLVGYEQPPTLAGVLPDERLGLGDDRPYQSDRCYEFDGLNSYVSGLSISFSGDFCISYRMKSDFVPAMQHLYASSQNRIYSTNPTSIVFIAGNVITDFTISLSTTDWNTITFTRTGSDLSLYVNGVFIDTKTNSSTLLISSITTTSSAFAGVMSDLRFYDAAKSAEQIASIHSGTDATFDNTNLVGFYKMEEVGGTIAYDSSGNGNHGTIRNATLATFHATDADLPHNWLNEVGYTTGIIKTGTDGWSDASAVEDYKTQLDGDFVFSFRVQESTAAGNVYYYIGLSALRFAEAGPMVPSVISVYRASSFSTSISITGTATTALAALALGDNVQIRRTSGLVEVLINDVVMASKAGVTATVFPQAYIFTANRGLIVAQVDGEYIDWDTRGTDIVESKVPRDESGPSLDVLGNALQYSGVAPNPGQAIGSPCGTFDGVDDYLSCPHLTGSETVVSSGGTSTPTVSAGRIDFTAGTCWNLVLSDGTHYAFAERGGATVHDVGEYVNHGAIMNATTSPAGTGFWANTQDVFHWALAKGFRASGDVEIPALADGSAAADGNPITNPARPGHNGGTTDLSLHDGVWSFNDDRTNPHFRRTLTDATVAVAADRFLSAPEELSGDLLDEILTYIETEEI